MTSNDDEDLESNSASSSALSPVREVQDRFSGATREQIKNLTEYFASTRAQQESRKHYLPDKPTSGISAVLVLLFEREGHLRVLLTTRAKGLKVHGGETCLPGGHMEDGDGRNIEVTAHREAHEEVSLPLFLPHIHTLGILEPHPFRHLIVVPVVALLTDNSILRQLKNREKEVEHIFSHPLEAILDPQLAGSICGEYSNAHGKDVKIGERLVEHGSEHWPHESKYQHHKDYVVQALGGMTYRLQRFQTSASPITGTTADILIDVAEIAYKRPPQYERYAFDQIREYDALMHRLEVEKQSVEGESIASGPEGTRV